MITLTAVLAAIKAFWINLVSIITFLLVLWAKIKVIYKRLEPLIDSAIKDAEIKAQDKVIGLEDRKEWALNRIADAQKAGVLRKFNFFERILLSKAIDYVAKKLPDFKFNKPPDNA